jgi:hypothetical protein
MNRLPALSEQQWSDEQRQLAEEIINGRAARCCRRLNRCCAARN